MRFSLPSYALLLANTGPAMSPPFLISRRVLLTILVAVWAVCALAGWEKAPDYSFDGLVARATPSLAAEPNPRILGGERMPVSAVCFSSIHCWKGVSAQQVLTAGYRLQMRRVAARPIPAEMIHIQAARNRTNVQFIHLPVGQARTRPIHDCDNSVPGRANGSSPDPALCRNLLQKHGELLLKSRVFSRVNTAFHVNNITRTAAPANVRSEG